MHVYYHAVVPMHMYKGYRYHVQYVYYHYYYVQYHYQYMYTLILCM